MNLDQLKEELRGRMGELSEAQLPDTQATRALKAALREFSRYRKRDTPMLINLAPNVYDYPLPEGTTAVADIFVFPTFLFWQNVDPLALSIKLPTLTTLGFMTIIGVKPIDTWPAGTQIIAPDPLANPPQTAPTLRLLSLPDVTAIMFLRAQTPLTYESLSEDECEHVLKFARGECLEWIGMRRSKPVKKVPTATGALTLDDGKDMRMEGRALKDEFRRDLGMGATVLDAG